jgi:hypothetical protein
MPGDVGLVAAFLTKALGFAVDETGYKELTRENKLKMLARGYNAAIERDDWATCDALLNEYRELRQQTGP